MKHSQAAVIYVPCVVITGSSDPIIHLHMTPLALQGPVSALLILIRKRYVQSLRNLSDYCSWHECLFRTTYSALYNLL